MQRREEGEEAGLALKVQVVVVVAEVVAAPAVVLADLGKVIFKLFLSICYFTGRVFIIRDMEAISIRTLQNAKRTTKTNRVFSSDAGGSTAGRGRGGL